MRYAQCQAIYMSVSYKRERKPSGQSRINNPESLETVGVQDTILMDLIDFCVLTPLTPYIMATSFSSERNRSTWRERPTMGMQLVSLITCGCESSAPFFAMYKAGRIGDTGRIQIKKHTAQNTKKMSN